MQGTNGCQDIESVAAVDINGNYYLIRKVPMGREGVHAIFKFQNWCRMA
jgi:hypothetical protein